MCGIVGLQQQVGVSENDEIAEGTNCKPLLHAGACLA